jgi:uncharacterized membrane protein YhhN
MSPPPPPPPLLAAAAAVAAYAALRANAAPLAAPGALLASALLKAAPAALLARWALRAAPRARGAALAAAALLLCALGDAALEAERARGAFAAMGIKAFPMFEAGLASFFAAHVLFAGALATPAPRLEPVVALAAATPAAIALRLLWPHVARDAAAAPLLPALAAYAGALALTFYAAVARGGARVGRDSWWRGVAGAALFMASDAALAFARFAPPPRAPGGGVRWWFAFPDAVVLATYWPAIALLAAAVVAAARPAEGAAAAAAAAPTARRGAPARRAVTIAAPTPARAASRARSAVSRRIATPAARRK